jgi:predicted nucleotidyltransferase
MEKASERLRKIVEERASGLSAEMRRRLDMASQVIVFGSFASSLETASSDIDVFCIGDCRTHFKSSTFEILILPEYDLYSELWLGSELANHISSYGVPLDSRPEWFSHARVSAEAVVRKGRRIRAYIQSLEIHLPELSSGAKFRYKIKIRRELQRLQLLQSGKPVPPTAILDGNTELIEQMEARNSSASTNYFIERYRELFAEASRARVALHD